MRAEERRAEQSGADDPRLDPGRREPADNGATAHRPGDGQQQVAYWTGDAMAELVDATTTVPGTELVEWAVPRGDGGPLADPPVRGGSAE